MNTEVIDRFCSENRISQTALEAAAGLSKGLISKWKSGEVQPSMRSMAKLSGYTGISVGELVSDSSSAAQYSSGSRSADVRAADTAGNVKDVYGTYIPVEDRDAYENSQCMVTVLDGKDIIEASASGGPGLSRFGFEMNDSGMEPYIFSGDLLTIERTRVFDTGDIILAAAGGELLCRKAVPQSGGLILQPLAPDFSARYFSGSYTVIGRVSGINRRI